MVLLLSKLFLMFLNGDIDVLKHIMMLYPEHTGLFGVRSGVYICI